MHKVMTIAAALLMGGTLAAAQNTNSSSQAPSTDSSRGSITQAVDEQQGSSLDGCLKLAENTFWLSDDHGNSYRLSGDKTELARLAGHHVRVSGTAGNNDKTFAVTHASDAGSTCSIASEPMGARGGNAPFAGNKAGTWGPPQDWHRGNVGYGVAETAPPDKNQQKPTGQSQNTGIAAPSSPANSSYEEHPAQPVPDSATPNPPLNHPRPEDQTPSVGTAQPTGGNTSGTASTTSPAAAAGAQNPTSTRHKHHHKHQQKKSNAPTSATSTPQTTTPPPQI